MSKILFKFLGHPLVFTVYDSSSQHADLITFENCLCYMYPYDYLIFALKLIRHQTVNPQFPSLNIIGIFIFLNGNIFFKVAMFSRKLQIILRLKNNTLLKNTILGLLEILSPKV